MSRDALIPDGAAYVPDADALCEQLGVVSLNVYDGHVYAVKRDGSESLLTELLAKANRPEVETSGDGKVAQFKPAPRRTD
jgi:hypothetical protein